jgi:hypothetical protein
MTRRRLVHFEETGYAGHLRQFSAPDIKARLKRIYRATRAKLRRPGRRDSACRESAQPAVGTIEWIVGNLCDLREIPPGTFDAVVSLSALEHIPIEQLGTALRELARVAKPGAGWAVTTSGTDRATTWLHEPSQGWCYSVADLRDRFGAVGARDQDAAEMLERYRRSKYLRDHLAAFYRRTDRCGMPWGVWDPRYIPVGLSRG